jgi:1-deoxy-D-xylulose-5-phosphate synthase
LGTRLGEALKAAEDLESYGISTTVADARFAKPLDLNLLRQLASNHEVLITIEEGSIGGFGSFVMQALVEDGIFDGNRKHALKFRVMTLPDLYLDHDAPEKLYARAELDSKAIVAKVLNVIGKSSDQIESLIA